ncbi:MAG: STAS/SEC14 domain-containing protein [Gammaproteobacteria bacterium]
MIKQLDDIPADVLGFAVEQKLTAEDYETVLIPAIENHLKTHSDVRALCVFGEEFDGVEAAAMWEDAKIGLKHIKAWERIAVVSDTEWIKTMVKVGGFALPFAVRTFDLDKLEDAKHWLA